LNRPTGQLPANDEMAAYVSVDIEAAGPIPARYSMLSIGACLVSDLECRFYVELKPEHSAFDPAALAVSGLSMEALAADGQELGQGMAAFKEWLDESVRPEQPPIFVAFNAPFDWAFINDAFLRTIGTNPFGHAALDIKAYSMGLTGSSWAETSFRRIAEQFLEKPALVHHALQDAVDQARVFRHMLRASDRSTQQEM